MNESDAIPKVSIIGMGNILLADDCFGPFTIEVFRSLYECGSGIEIVDVGTPGSDLAPYLYGRDLVIVVDAVSDNGPPGTLCTYDEGTFLRHSAQLRVTNHDPGMQETLAQLRLVNRGPMELIVIGVIPESCEYGEQVSASVLKAGFEAAEQIMFLLRQRGFDCGKRIVPANPKLWWMSESLEKQPDHKTFASVSLNPN